MYSSPNKPWTFLYIFFFNSAQGRQEKAAKLMGFVCRVDIQRREGLSILLSTSEGNPRGDLNKKRATERGAERCNRCSLSQEGRATAKRVAHLLFKGGQGRGA